VRLAAKHAWLIVIPLIVTTAAAVAIGARLPKKFKSDTLIMLVPQRIPDSYVKSAGSDSLDDRVATLNDQLLSRSRLERIILDLNLYVGLRKTLPMEDVVERMRRDITLSTTQSKGGSKESTSFRIEYVSNDSKIAQKTAERLASLFIEENMRDRENVAEDTSQFLASQMQDARQRLIEQEKKLEDYRHRYSGQLPSQATANLQAIQNAQLQLQSLREATDRARERRLLMERQIADLQTPDPLTAAVAPVTGQTPPVETTSQQLEAARARLRVLETHDKPTHPDVLMAQRTIRDLETKLKAEQAAAPARETGGDAVVAPAEVIRQRRLRDLKGQMEEVDRELADKQQQAKNLHDVIADYQSKLDAVPSRESDLVELTRDYNTLQATYQSLLAKREESKLAANLEHRSIGEQFRILDPARVPETPFSPNLVAITGGGAACGLLIGLVIIGFLEYRNSSFQTGDDVVRLCQLPVLASVPLMKTDDERRKEWRRAALLNAAAICVVLVSAGVIVLSTLRP
jgi:polysaccharide chain length determinant protein (PEP-CTERM system associated)